MLPTDLVRIRRLRFSRPAARQSGARHDTELAFADAVSTTACLKQSILCIRRLVLAGPRATRVKRALDGEAVEAARPVRGCVPANANAVFFADQAELLACLARDWCAGTTTEHWWWSMLFPRDEVRSVVRRAWLADARPLPAALARLHAAKLGAKFLSRLAADDLSELWWKMVETFHLEELDVAWLADGISASRSATHVPMNSAPWARSFHSDAPLTPVAARVLITAVLLEAEPGLVRSTRFAREVRRFTHSAFAARPGIPHADEQTGALHLDSSRASEALVRTSAARSRTLHPPAEAPDAAALRGGRHFAAAVEPLRRKQRVGSVDLDAKLDCNVSIEEAHFRGNDEVPVPLPDAPAPDRVRSEWGGVLYLVNVATALGLYGDFTEPARPSLALPLWDFLALLGRRMIGAQFEDDPLPGFFARLSGRDNDEPPGARFEPPLREPLGDWVERIERQVHERLAAALRLDAGEELSTVVLHHPATIDADSTRVDAQFSLAIHPIALRVAGLDRDPGWVPAAARTIAFHYE
jgi:hypothetical protein